MVIMKDGNCVNCQVCIGCANGREYEVEVCNVCGCENENLFVDNLDEVICDECLREYVRANFSDFMLELGYKQILD